MPFENALVFRSIGREGFVFFYSPSKGLCVTVVFACNVSIKNMVAQDTRFILISGH